MLQIRCKNTNETKSFPVGSSLLEILPEFNLKFRYPVVSAKVNNASQGLKFRLYQNRDIEYVGLDEPGGMRAYIRSLCFVLCKASQDVFPGSKLYIEHPISRGYYCNFIKTTAKMGHSEGASRRGVTAEDVDMIRRRMQEIITSDYPFHRSEMPTEDAIRLSVQLLACGLRPISFSTDDYFVNSSDTPLLPNGQYDFDNFETVDHNHAEPILSSVPKNCPEYAEAHRLLKFIHYFTLVSDKEIPPTSIMREFVGGSSFKY